VRRKVASVGKKKEGMGVGYDAKSPLPKTLDRSTGKTKR